MRLTNSIREEIKRKFLTKYFDEKTEYLKHAVVIKIRNLLSYRKHLHKNEIPPVLQPYVQLASGYRTVTKTSEGTLLGQGTWKESCPQFAVPASQRWSGDLQNIEYVEDSSLDKAVKSFKYHESAREQARKDVGDLLLSVNTTAKLLELAPYLEEFVPREGKPADLVPVDLLKRIEKIVK